MCCCVVGLPAPDNQANFCFSFVCLFVSFSNVPNVFVQRVKLRDRKIFSVLRKTLRCTVWSGAPGVLSDDFKGLVCLGTAMSRD